MQRWPCPLHQATGVHAPAWSAQHRSGHMAWTQRLSCPRRMPALLACHNLHRHRRRGTAPPTPRLHALAPFIRGSLLTATHLSGVTLGRLHISIACAPLQRLLTETPARLWLFAATMGLAAPAKASAGGAGHSQAQGWRQRLPQHLAAAAAARPPLVGLAPLHAVRQHGRDTAHRLRHWASCRSSPGSEGEEVRLYSAAGGPSRQQAVGDTIN